VALGSSPVPRGGVQGGAVGARAAPAAPAFSGQGYSMTGPSSNAVEQAGALSSRAPARYCRWSHSFPRPPPRNAVPRRRRAPHACAGRDAWAGRGQALAAAGVDANTDPELAAAIAASLGSAAAAPAPPSAGAGAGADGAGGAVDEREAMRLKRLARFG
jgi:hypothetical protein